MPEPRKFIPFASRAGLAIALAAFAAIGIYVFGVGRGFDFTDEGFYYLAFAHPENVSDNQTSFHFFGAQIFALLGHSIVAMRIATLVAVLISTGMLLWGTGRFLRSFAPELMPDPEHKWLVLGSALTASFLGFAISPAALSYNFQNACCLQAATGCLLAACAQAADGRLADRRILLALAGFGVLCGADFFIKFSTSVPLAAGGGVFFLLTSTVSARRKAVLGLGLLLGPVLAGAVYFGFFQDLSRWREGFGGTLWAITGGGYATAEVRRYGGEIAGLVMTTLRYFAPVWVVAGPAMILMPVLRRRPRLQAGAAIVGGIWTLAHLGWLVLDQEYQRTAALTFYLGSLLLLALLVAGSHLAGRTPGLGASPGRWRPALAGLLLLLLPYLGAFGTNNAINRNALYQLAPWFVVAALLLAEIDRIWRTSWPSRIGLVVLSVMAGIQFYHGYWLEPYRAGGARGLQTIPTALGEPATIVRLTPAVNGFLTTSRRLLDEHGFKAGDDLLVFFDLPGFAFAMGGVSPGHPWYFAGDKTSLDLDAMRVGFIPTDRRHRAFIVRNSLDPDWNDFLPRLREAGLNFPADYQLISPPEMVSPLTRVPFQIWAPNSRLAAP